MPSGTPTLVDCLTRAAGLPDAGVRVVGRDGAAAWMSWPALAARALRVAGALRRLGVRRDDRVAIVYPTGFEFLEALFGVMSAGAVPVPVYPPGHLGRLDEYHARTSRTLTLAGARLVLADRLVRLVLGETIARAVPPLGCLSLDGLPEGAAPHAWPAADLALIQFSSGTTGDPRPVALSQRAVAAQVGLLNRFWQDDEATTHSGLSWLPLYHDMGLIGAVLTALARPATITLIPPEIFIARPAVWLRAISDYGATISPSPTFGYARCTERIRDEEMHGVDLSRWRVALCGGEQAVPAVLRAFASRFSRWGFSPEALSPVYGLAEATLAVTFSDLTRPFVARRFEREALAIDGRAVEADRGVEIASVGRPLPGFAVRIVGDRRRVLADGRVGVIECRGPSIMDGYFQQPESTARILRDGWLDTGDLGFVQGGELYVTGRAKDMLLIRGRNHAPDEVERAVEGVPGVRAGRAVAVSWLPEGASGELLYVFVEARVGVPAAQFDEVARLAAEAIVSATGLSPERVIVVASGTLPRTTSGKLRRREALRRHLDGALAAPSAVTPAGLVGAVTRSWLAYRRSARR